MTSRDTYDIEQLGAEERTMIAWTQAYYGQLIGARIVGLTVEVDESNAPWIEVWPAFTVELADGSRRVIGLLQDEEGNGPGFLDGLQHVDWETVKEASQRRLDLFGGAKSG